MKLVSENLNNQLNELIGKCFAINRMLDRGMSLLTVRWGMIRTSEILHPKIAHAYPSDKFADSISAYQALRNMESTYPLTPVGDRDYKIPIEFFKDYFQENLEFEDMIKEAIITAKDDEDYQTKKFLNGLLNRLVPYTAFSQDLVGLIDSCENDNFKLMMLDSNIEKYIPEL